MSQSGSSVLTSQIQFFFVFGTLRDNNSITFHMLSDSVITSVACLLFNRNHFKYADRGHGKNGF